MKCSQAVQGHVTMNRESALNVPDNETQEEHSGRSQGPSKRRDQSFLETKGFCCIFTSIVLNLPYFFYKTV